MATDAQIQGEIWWQREIVTTELDWLGDEMCRRTQRPRAAAGTKGNTVHLSGGHRAQEWIQRSAYCTNRTYATQPGLTAEQARHIAAFDFTPGSADQMIAQCKRLMAALKAGVLEEVVEFYGNVDGDQIVDGWDNLRNRADSSDKSHLWHWHARFNRTKVRDLALMKRIVAIAMGDDMADALYGQDDDQRLKAIDVRQRPLATGDEGPYPVTWTANTADTETHWLVKTVKRIAADVTAIKTALASAPAPVLTDEQLQKLAAQLAPTVAAAVVDQLRAHPLAPMP